MSFYHQTCHYDTHCHRDNLCPHDQLLCPSDKFVIMRPIVNIIVSSQRLTLSLSQVCHYDAHCHRDNVFPPDELLCPAKCVNMTLSVNVCPRDELLCPSDDVLRVSLRDFHCIDGIMDTVREFWARSPVRS